MSEGRPDFNGSNYDDAFVGDLVNFVASNKFQSMFENYFLSHALFFSDDEERGRTKGEGEDNVNVVVSSSSCCCCSVLLGERG